MIWYDPGRSSSEKEILSRVMSSPNKDLGWLRSPLWDACLLAFGWVPFYLWVVLYPLMDANASLGPLLVVALALNFLHRHYVLLLVYGDRDVFEERRRAYVAAPLVAFVAVATLVLSGLPAGKEVLFGALGTWNVWHVIQQRYGLLRAYAARAKGGLETREASRRDFRLLWAAVLVTAPLVVLGQRSVIESRPEAAPVFSVIGPWLAPSFVAIVAAVFAALFLAAFVAWARGEARAHPLARAPRYVFLGSTFALLGIFVLHGPVVGYLVFGVAHSVEYLGFVHHFGERKYKGTAGAAAARLLGDVRRAPVLLAPLFLAYLLLHAHRFTLAYVTYFSTTSALHYLYDGWIWRLRQPKVSEPLVNPARV
jgi:hypothetical protein